MENYNEQCELATDAEYPITTSKLGIHIEECLIGYFIQIGCQRIAVESVENAVKVLHFYLSNKKECFELYSKGGLEDKVKEVLNK